MPPPQFIMIAGPNGSGKSTSAPALLPSSTHFLNADTIESFLPEISTSRRDFEAGRILIAEWDRLAGEKANFAVETTLASRTLVPRIQSLLSVGYEFHLIFFWLPSADLAVGRVAERVRQAAMTFPNPLSADDTGQD